MTREELEKLADEFADNKYRRAGCSPNTDGKWWVHKEDFIKGFLQGARIGFEAGRSSDFPKGEYDYETADDFLKELETKK